jgi:hypothetical protein
MSFVVDGVESETAVTARPQESLQKSRELDNAAATMSFLMHMQTTCTNYALRSAARQSAAAPCASATPTSSVTVTLPAPVAIAPVAILALLPVAISAHLSVAISTPSLGTPERVVIALVFDAPVAIASAAPVVADPAATLQDALPHPAAFQEAAHRPSVAGIKRPSDEVKLLTKHHCPGGASQRIPPTVQMVHIHSLYMYLILDSGGFYRWPGCTHAPPHPTTLG